MEDKMHYLLKKRKEKFLRLDKLEEEHPGSVSLHAD